MSKVILVDREMQSCTRETQLDPTVNKWLDTVRLDKQKY